MMAPKLDFFFKARFCFEMAFALAQAVLELSMYPNCSRAYGSSASASQDTYHYCTSFR